MPKEVKTGNTLKSIFKICGNVSNIHQRVFLIYKQGEPIFIVNMGVSVYTESMLNSHLIEDIRAAMPKDCKTFTGDGEFISSTGDFYDFLSQRHNLTEDVVSLKLWSTLSVPISLDCTPYLEIRQWMEHHLQETKRVSLIAETLLQSKQDILDYFEKTSETYEGVVLKPPNLPYTADWLKIRKSETADVVIMGIKKTDTWRKHKIPQTFLIGGYDKNTGTVRRIGDVSSWVNVKNQKALLGEALSKHIKFEDKDYVHVKPAAVLEIQYHQRMENGLRFPVITRLRFDKRPEDCPYF